MKTCKKDKTVEMLLKKARDHFQLATIDLIFVDMASQELNVAIRLAKPKKGYSIIDVINEMHEYTSWNEILKNPIVNDYVFAVDSVKSQYKHKKQPQNNPGATPGKGFQ